MSRVSHYLNRHVPLSSCAPKPAGTCGTGTSSLPTFPWCELILTAYRSCFYPVADGVFTRCCCDLRMTRERRTATLVILSVSLLLNDEITVDDFAGLIQYLFIIRILRGGFMDTHLDRENGGGSDPNRENGQQIPSSPISTTMPFGISTSDTD